MFRENNFYGHRDIFAQYIGTEPQPLRGTLQHGWNTIDGFGGLSDHADFPLRYVWSAIFARRGQSLGYRNYRVVGAPWSYLCEMNRDQINAAQVSEHRNGTIFFPFHGWEGAGVIGDYAALIDEIKRVEGDAKVTVCLYWLEFKNDSIRELFEEAGFRVISNGHRDFEHDELRNDFLDRQLAECLKHSKVASNRMCTAIVYGASVGCDVGIYGDPMELDRVDSPINFLRGRAELMYPTFVGEHVKTAHVSAIARSQLGMDSLLSPSELAVTLEWNEDSGLEGLAL